MDFKYPYTDFHELNLDWFLAEFKKLTADWLQLQHDWEDEQQAFQDLHDYVQDYFANLNLYQEVHDILYSPEMQQTIQLMLSNISASQLPTVVANQIASVVASQLAPVVAAQLPNLLNSMIPSFLPDAVAGEAAAWLADHVDPDTGYVIDDSLTVLNAAADARVTGYEIRDRLRVYKNLYDPDNVLLNGYYRYDGTLMSDTSYISTSLIEVEENTRYRDSIWDVNVSVNVTFWDANQQYLSGVANLPDGYITTPPGCKYVRIAYYRNARYDHSFCIGEDKPPAGLPFDVPVYMVNGKLVQFFHKDVEQNFDYRPLTKVSSEVGLLKANGQIDASYTASRTDEYDVSSYDTIYLTGSSQLTTSFSHYCLYDSNDTMIGAYVYTPTTNWNNKVVYCKNAVKLKINAHYSVNIVTLKDDYVRKYLFPNQWEGKTWYGYGTSITNTNAEGKYPTYLAQMSGMSFVNKGISGGGIGNLGAYSTGQVYAAICNTTDGKLNADLITLETGANDVNANVPLGTVYDTGTSTLAGCLNDCIRYLQNHTHAQIVVIPSPANKTTPDAANKVYEWAKMIEEICNINRVHFCNNNCNEGYAKITGPDGSDYVVDNIHQTNLGGYVMAENIWMQLRNIPVFRTVLP